MKARPTYGAVLSGSPRPSMDDSYEQNAMGGPEGQVVWVERLHHPPEVAPGDCLVGPLAGVLEGDDFEPDSQSLVLFSLDPSSRVTASKLAALLLATDARCRFMWDGRRAAIWGAPEGADELETTLREQVEGEPIPVQLAVAPRLRPRGSRGRPVAFPARARRRVEYERNLRRLAPVLADVSGRLRSWGASGTAAAIDGLLTEIADPRSGLSRPGDAEAVAVAEGRIEQLAAALTAPASAPPIPALIEAAADAYLAALVGRQKTIVRACVFFGSTLKLHLPVEREGFVELPASFAESLGAWALAALPLARHELDPFGLEEPTVEALAGHCLQLVGDQFRYALERWGVGDIAFERELVAALQGISAPTDKDLPEPIGQIARLVAAAEAGDNYVNETKIMLVLAAGRSRS